MRFQTLYEARWIFAVLAFLGLASAIFLPWLLLPVLALTIYVFWFFRDPERVSPTDPSRCSRLPMDGSPTLSRSTNQR
jgi:Phosphatidylserine decarboxylase